MPQPFLRGWIDDSTGASQEPTGAKRGGSHEEERGTLVLIGPQGDGATASDGLVLIQPTAVLKVARDRPAPVTSLVDKMGSVALDLIGGGAGPPIGRLDGSGCLIVGALGLRTNPSSHGTECGAPAAPDIPDSTLDLVAVHLEDPSRLVPCQNSRTCAVSSARTVSMLLRVGPAARRLGQSGAEAQGRSAQIFLTASAALWAAPLMPSLASPTVFWASPFNS